MLRGDIEMSEPTNKEHDALLRPAAYVIYEKLFPGCMIGPVGEPRSRSRFLDKDCAIDVGITLPSGATLTVQEKYRKHAKYTQHRVDPEYPDFTQGYMKDPVAGTEGEWFHLFAQYYFYGWADDDGTGFEDWYLLNVADYVVTVERAGGLEAIGKWQANEEYSTTTFCAIPIIKLQPAWVARSGDWKSITAPPREGFGLRLIKGATR